MSRAFIHLTKGNSAKNICYWSVVVCSLHTLNSWERFNKNFFLEQTRYFWLKKHFLNWFRSKNGCILREYGVPWQKKHVLMHVPCRKKGTFFKTLCSLLQKNDTKIKRTRIPRSELNSNFHQQDQTQQKKYQEHKKYSKISAWSPIPGSPDKFIFLWVCSICFSIIFLFLTLHLAIVRDYVFGVF